MTDPTPTPEQLRDAVIEAARADHETCERERRNGMKAHPCRVCDALSALEALPEAPTLESSAEEPVYSAPDVKPLPRVPAGAVRPGSSRCASENVGGGSGASVRCWPEPSGDAPEGGLAPWYGLREAVWTTLRQSLDASKQLNGDEEDFVVEEVCKAALRVMRDEGYRRAPSPTQAGEQGFEEWWDEALISDLPRSSEASADAAWHARDAEVEALRARAECAEANHGTVLDELEALRAERDALSAQEGGPGWEETP